MEFILKKDKIKKPQIHLALDEKQLEYLNSAKEKYFPLNYENMSVQDVVRAIIQKDMNVSS